MRRWLAAAAALFISLPSAAPADVTSFTSGNVEVVRTLAGRSGSGMRVVGRHLYVATAGSLTIYDVSEPTDPVEISRVSVPQHDDDWLSEDFETNGKIGLLLSRGALFVVDVEDKDEPSVIGSLLGHQIHTIECVWDCTYGYADNGHIVDLRQPHRPRIVGNWKKRHPVRTDHAVTEVRPGLVLTASQPMRLLNARRDPARPTLLATIDEHGFVHQTLWPGGGARFALTGGESDGPNCSAAEAALKTWDTRSWRATRTFSAAAEWRPPVASPPEGGGLVSIFCGHWFEPHPDNEVNGVVAASWYGYGTHLLKIDRRGDIERIGWYTPPLGNSYTTAWGSSDILYVSDSYQGLHVLRVSGLQ